MSGKKKSDNVTVKTAQQAAKPANFYSPLGNLVKGRYSSPMFDSNFNQQRATANTGITKTLGNLAGYANETPESVMNNPWTGVMSNYLRGRINRDYQDSLKTYTDEMNARNQLGGSYEAYRRSLLDRDYQSQLADADMQSMLEGVNQYERGFNRQAALLSALRGDMASAMDQAYYPAKIGMGYVGSVAPLQTALLNTYNTQMLRPMAQQQQMNDALQGALGWAMTQRSPGPNRGQQAANAAASMFGGRGGG